jgi:3-oxoadipate enol-lactonase
VSVKLHCVATGAGRDLVLLHPVGLDHTFWGSLAKAASESRRVVAVDLRGHGRSPAAGRETAIDDYADDVHAAIERHCRGPAAVLGLSFGGMVAQLVALRHPHAVSALVLSGCGGGFAPDVRPLLRERGLAAERDGMEAIVGPTIERWFTAAFRDDPEVERVRERLRTNDVVSWSVAWHAISTFDALPRLGEIAVPALVVAGERDAATPPAATAKLAESIDGARCTTLAGAPHMMQIECRDAYDAAVLEFLGEGNG